MEVIYKMAKILASIAMAVTVLNVNSACFFTVHQPKLPKGAERLKSN